MKKIIYQYPVLEPSLIKEVGLKEGAFTVRFTHDNVEYKEEYSGKGQYKVLLGNYELWDPKHVNVVIERTISLEKPWKLYGENGVIPQGAEIGIAAEFLSAKSNQRFIFWKKTFSFRSFAGKLSFTQQLPLPKNTFRETGEIVSYLYLAKKSNSYTGRKANENGLVLGYLTEPITVVFDGIGSLFPVVIVDLGVNGPLWKMQFNSIEPDLDLFEEENICLVLNSLHPQFKELKINDFKTSNPLMNEVFVGWISSAFIIIKNNHEHIYGKIVNGQMEAFKNQSIGGWLCYFAETFEINLTKTEELFSTINIAVHKMLG